MQHIILTILIGTLAGSAWAGTFELSDPANEIYEEQNAPPEEEPAAEAPVEPTLRPGMSCAVDTDTGACLCTEKNDKRPVPLSREECAAQVEQALELFP